MADDSGAGRTVVIIAPRADIHAVAVARAVDAHGAPVAIVDPERNSPAPAVDVDLPAGELRIDDVTVDARTTVWLRRVRHRAADGRVSDPRLVSFIRQEWRNALLGGLLSTGCRLVNDPMHEYRATFKPWQLSVAAREGLLVPDTRVTNVPGVARDLAGGLAARSSRTVFKPLSPLPMYHLGETRELDTGVIDEEQFRLAPMILQECIEKGLDLRVFVAGSEVYAAAVRTAHAELIDWRLDPVVTYEDYPLPVDVRASLGRLVSALGLVTASLDLRVDPDGRLWFFEANPSGQFLMLQQATGARLTDMMARLLIA